MACWANGTHETQAGDKSLALLDGAEGAERVEDAVMVGVVGDHRGGALGVVVGVAHGHARAHEVEHANVVAAVAKGDGLV